jgi:hypothetical protein
MIFHAVHTLYHLRPPAQLGCCWAFRLEARAACLTSPVLLPDSSHTQLASCSAALRCGLSASSQTLTTTGNLNLQPRVAHPLLRKWRLRPNSSQTTLPEAVLLLCEVGWQSFSQRLLGSEME